MNSGFNPAPATILLADAWRAGRQLTELPEAIRPRSVSEGYEVQDLLFAELDTKSAGWKLGVGSPLQKRQSGLGRAIAGRLLSSRLYSPNDTVIVPNSAPVTIEFEIACVLGRDISPTEADFPLLDAVAEYRVAFELVLSRFTDRRAVGWPSFAADNAGFEALVLGSSVEWACISDLVATLLVTCDGKDAARSMSGGYVSNPIEALTDLVAIARERGWPMREGNIISTGTVSKPFDIAAKAADVKATFLGDELAFRLQRAPIQGHCKAGGLYEASGKHSV